MTELLLIPNVTPFESLKSTVPEVAVWVPAAMPAGAVVCEKLADAVTVPAARPKLTLFEFENVKADDRLEVVPADKLMLAAPAGPALAVSVLPASPKLTLFASDTTSVPRVAVTTPATTATGVLRVISAMSATAIVHHLAPILPTHPIASNDALFDPTREYVAQALLAVFSATRL
jgi:hypothetical protein